jgi:poly(hydroxyalkanoate) depolymerase family esterase
MLVRSVVAAGFAVAVAVLPGCAVLGSEDVDSSNEALSSIPNETAWAAGTNWTYESDFMGLPRAWVYRPTSFSKKSPTQRGVIFHLIGCGEMPFQVGQGGGWPEAAEAHGMVIVIPDILAPSHPNSPAPNVACYDFGSGLASEPTRNSADHKAIIAAGQRIVADATLKIDPRQVYLTGFSAGATVAMQVACMAPDIFAGVGSVAGPSMGTDQSKAVMPPSNTADQVRSKCTTYAGANKDKLGTQLYAIVSDNNGLPAGNPVMIDGHWTADKFEKQTIWDGDKYVPHAHHALITGAMATLFNARKTSTGVSLPLDGDASGAPFSGNGTGCQGGASSHDDTGETECKFAEAVARPWQAKADVWTDAQGRKRIVYIQQDTLRHRWPAGPFSANAHDAPVTPDHQALVDGGYIDSTGQFDIEKVNAAPNGTLGGVFFARDSFDFPMFFVDYLAANNPRLPASPSSVVTVSAQAEPNAAGTSTVVSGTATAAANAHVTSVTVTFQGTDHAATITTGQAAVDFSVTLDTHGLATGSYSATVKANDDAGHATSSEASFQIGGNAQCFTAKNSEHVSAGRAHYGVGNFKAYANGSNDDLGYAFLANDQQSSVSQQSEGHWVKVDSCP